MYKAVHYILTGILFLLSSIGIAFAEDSAVIFKKSTVWRALTPNDKLAVRVIEDPYIQGIACYFTIPERGGISGTLGVAEEVSDISISCQQVGPIVFKQKSKQGETVLTERRSFMFKKMRIVRGCDTGRNTLIYMVYSDKLMEGSPKNSTSAVALRPWGTQTVPKCVDWFSD